MKDYKTNELVVDVSISCDNYDIANRVPLDAIHIGITVKDETEGTERRLDETVEPGKEAGGEWGFLVNRVLEMVHGLPDIVGDDWFDVSEWSYMRGPQKSNQAYIHTEWVDKELWLGLRTYPADDNNRGWLHISGRGRLTSLVDEIMAIEPCAWFLPTYKPDDWLAHKGWFSLSSFDEGESDWTRQKILRGLDVATAELAHYRKMARIYEEKTGITISSAVS